MDPVVLIVDDDRKVRQLLEAMLIPEGYHIVLASNGSEGITQALDHRPDVILLDVMMPDIDGFGVAAELQADARTRDIPIVMVTALGDVSDRVKALESGADDFLTKPVDKIELRVRVKTLIQKSQRLRRRRVPGSRKSQFVLLSLIAVVVTLSAIFASKIVYAASIDDAILDAGLSYESGYQAGVKESVVLNPETEVEYREVVREVVKEVAVIEFVAQREFSSTNEIEEWLAQDDTNEYIFLFTDDQGILRSSDQYDCDDYALQLQERALEEGYLMSVTIVASKDGPHMINLITIGNEVYYIEPQTDEYWFYSLLDVRDNSNLSQLLSQ